MKFSLNKSTVRYTLTKRKRKGKPLKEGEEANSK